jgi:periplasmic copper chaperone A
MRRILFSLFVLGIVMAAHAGPPPVSVSDARVRWLPGELPMAGYFVITSHAPGPLRLTGASSPAFGHVMLHRSVEEAGVTHMAHVDGVDLAPGQSVTFAPGGYHLMLMHRTRDLQMGEAVPVILSFRNGQTLAVSFRVTGAQGE